MTQNQRSAPMREAIAKERALKGWPTAPATVADFESRYADRSGVSVQWLHENGRWGAPCDCEESGCEGFQMLHKDERDHG